MASVTYNGNGSTGGAPPVDGTVYNNGDTVTVLGNTGPLVNGTLVFAYWSDAANGIGNVYFPGATFKIAAANVTLFAQWYSSAGLGNSGVSASNHYTFLYHYSFSGGNEPARTESLRVQSENDFTWMNGLFNNIDIPFTYPLQVYVTNLGGGASWSPLLLKGGGNNVNYLRDLMVSEVTEMFMLQQNNLNLPHRGFGYYGGAGTEESNGEGLSHYLNEQFEIRDGRPPGLAFNASRWLNSSLPGDPLGVRYSNDAVPYDYGQRYDYVNNTINDNRNSPASGCSVMFLWYLTTQLGFTAAEICQNATPTLGGVYNNLTGDNGDAFPLFKALSDNAFPQNTAATIPLPNQDNPFPLALLSFWVDKSTFGRDEVQDVVNVGGRFENAFWLVLEGFNRNTYLSLNPTISAFTGNFMGITDIQVVPNGTYVTYENTGNPKAPQRIRLGYDIIFTQNSLNNFPATGSGPSFLELDASVTIGGNVIPASNATTFFELVSGADPYFTNINPQADNDFWLSQDLRVFTVTPGINNAPFGDVTLNKPTLTPASVFNLDAAAGFNYAQSLINYLNTNYSNPGGTDPFSLLPGQGTALSDASSVAEYTITLTGGLFPQFYQNYCFAVARVRLKGVVGSSSPANNTKVFFRLWKAQSPDTNFGNDHYPSNVDSSGSLLSPLAPPDNNTIPMFASGNYTSNSDYSGSTINNRTLQITTSDYIWAYYVCYLNLYDGSNVYNGGESVVTGWPVGTHHCIVAQIAYDGAPILNTGIVKNPDNCDKLAQRNLQLTYADNPGPASTHRIPQAFDIKPSIPFVKVPGVLSYPDELMIDWGSVPAGSIANIYWPQVNSSDVIDLANALYGNHVLSAADSHTVQCKTVDGVTYIPIPTGSGENFAGLFTVDLPSGIVAGQVFDITVKKISTHGRTFNTTAVEFAAGDLEHHTDENVRTPRSFMVSDQKPMRSWRYVTGTFHVRIPVTTKEVMLVPEENTLAIMKARLGAMSPANRWYPVIQRYIAYISARVDGLGGDSASIKPSFNGIAPQYPAGSTPEPTPTVKDKCCKEIRWLLAIIILLLFILILILLLKK